MAKISIFRRLFPITMICIIILMLLIFLSRTFNINGLLLADSSKYRLTDWKFTWSQIAPPTGEPASGWKFSNRQIGISRPFGGKYVHLQTILPEIKEDSVLKITTLNNPIMVTGNEKTLLDNGYSSGYSWSGNQENSVKLDSTFSKSTIDIYMISTTGFSFESFLRPASTILVSETYYNLFQIISGFILLAVGLFVMFLTILFSIRNKKILNLTICGTLSFLTGMLFILPHLNFFYVNSNKPVYFTLQLICLMLIFAFFMILTTNIIGKFSKWAKINSIFLFIYPLAFMLIADQDILLYMLLAFPIIMLASLIVFFIPILGSVKNVKIETSWVYAGYILFGFTFIYDFAAYVYGISNTMNIYKFFGIFIFLAVLTIVSINKFIISNIREDERQNQINRDATWTDRIIRACSQIFAQKEIDGFCVQTAKSLKDLVIKDLADQEQKTINESIQEENISINVGLKTSEGYKEIFSEGDNTNCNYKLIEDKHLNKIDEQVFFGSSYIDILLFEKGNLICIIHFEGISRGLSVNLKNIVMIAYSNISVALDNLSLKFDMTRTQETIFFNLADISESKSEETGVHPKRVAEYVRVICEEMLMTPKQIEIVSRASMMHDIGKLAIPEEIITKKGILTTKEYETVKQHVLFGYHIMSKSPGDFMQAAAIIAQQHHERWNGEGYLGLKGEEIHPYARIVSLVDVFDALLTERSYKPAWSFEQTCGYINEKSGIQFDPKVVEVFNRVFYRLYKIRERNPN